MTRPEKAERAVPSIEQIQQEWHELTLRVAQLEAEKSVLEQENKDARFLLERVIEHRQKSHGELVMLLTGLVSRLAINDVGTIVSKLVEHNVQVSEICTALAKGKAEAGLPRPSILQALDQVKRDLAAAVKPVVEELIGFETPLEADVLQSVSSQPELFFSPRVGRANRCFIKGQVPRERIVREFGEDALIFFNDATTDRKLNPHPKPEEIALAFKDDFEALFKQHAALLPDKRKQLLALYQKIQRSKAPTEQARLQKGAFQKLSFYLELLHYYENQNTEAPDVVFAQRLPALIEQLAVTGVQDNLDEKLISEAEGLVEFVINPDHRQAIVNNLGKGGGLAKSLKYVLTLRAKEVSRLDQVIAEFVRHLIPPRQEKAPPPEPLVSVLRLVNPDMQRLVVNAIMESDRIRKEEAEALGREVGKRLGLTGLDAPIKVPENIPVATERQIAWGNISDLIARRNEPTVIADAIRDRLHTRYDADELKQSWIILIETDAISLIRIFCQLPYLADGKTDPVARAVMESYVTRLMHEKYATTHHKVVNSLKNMFKANPNSPTLVNFLALVKWVDSEAADVLSREIGMPASPA